MKTEELKVILEDAGMDVTAKIAKIQALNGVDIKVQQDKGVSDYNALQAKFDEAKKSWEQEKSKYQDYVTKDDHQKVLDELNGFKEKEEKGRQKAFLSSQNVKKGYEDLVASKLDWTKASYDEEKKIFTGKEFDSQFEPLKKQYPDLFEATKIPSAKGYYGKGKDIVDLTDL